MSSQNAEPSMGLMPKDDENKQRFEQILQTVLPVIGTHEGKTIIAEILVALKLEGVIGSSLSDRETEMIKIIKDAIVESPMQKQEALSYAQKLLNPSSGS